MLKYKLEDQMHCHDFTLLKNFLFLFFKELSHLSKSIHSLTTSRLHKSLVGPL